MTGALAQRILILAFILTVAVSLATADTVHLKNGREIKGTVASFDNGEFVVYVPARDGRPDQHDRLILLVDTVESIQFEAASPSSTLPTPTPTPAPAPPLGTITLDASKDVVPTGVMVHRGDRVKVTGTGQIQFPDGRATGPAGLDTRESWPFPGERLGVLIAIVGDPQSSSIYHVIGEANEFEARKDGEVFLQINARSLKDVRGSYNAQIQVGGATAAQLAPEPAPTTASTGSRQLHRQFDVPANKEWLDTGLDLLEGDTITIKAEGTIYYTSDKTCGPDGGERTWGDLLRALPVNDAGRGALIGLIGQQGVARPFFIGSSGKFKVQQTGRLFLGINDDTYQSNDGSFRATIDIVPTAR